MPAWVWILLGLTALGVALLLINDRTGVDVAERFGGTLTILFILAALAAIVLGFATADWR